MSTYMREDFKEQFMAGYNKMLEVINPSAIICYGTPFKEMKSNIKAVDPFNRTELIKKNWTSRIYKEISRWRVVS